MSDFTFLTKEELKLRWDRPDLFKKRGTEAGITDFAILLGGYCLYNRLKDDRYLEAGIGSYLTKSDDGMPIPRVVCNTEGRESDVKATMTRKDGVRPVLPFTEVNSIPTNGESGERAEDGVLEVEYGYYPQKAVPGDIQDRLESAYKSGTISRTKNSYTTDSARHDDYVTPFQPQTHQEYEYDGKRYVRVIANPFYPDFSLSNGEQYKDGDIVWVEVSPVKWWVDEENHKMMTENIILAGLQFDREDEYHTEDFDKTFIKRFMDEYLSKELVQSRGPISLEEQTEQANRAEIENKEIIQEEALTLHNIKEVEEYAKDGASAYTNIGKMYNSLLEKELKDKSQTTKDEENSRD